MKSLFIVIALVVNGTVWASNRDKLKSVRNINRIAFGSCNKQFMPQPLWPQLIKEHPDLFIWGGDNIYANDADPKKIEAAYELQNQQSDYKMFKNVTPFIGTWDDHDFTDDNANGHYKFKQTSQKLFLNFIEEPKGSHRWKQEGVYTSYTFGPEEKQVKIILLDTRYFKDVDKDAKLLGKKQWEWFEREVTHSKAKLLMIVGGFPMMSIDMPMSVEWADYPEEKLHLLEVVKKTSSPVLFLTGDKHFGSIYRGVDDHVELLASGMTHTAKAALRPYIRAKFANYVFDLHYAMIEIEWQNSIPLLTLSIRNEKGISLVSQKFKWNGVKWMNP
jgi:alkaline phosphatase D